MLLAAASWVTAPAVAATVAVIEIRSEITKGLERYIGRALAEAEASADAVVFDMHTPGGRVDVMGDVVNHIFESDLPTITHVRTEAISAGALIALATDQIVMAGGSAIGDAAPVDQSGAELGEKVISYMRGKVRATAERNGRNPDIAEAMVDKSKTLVLSDGEAEALTRAELAQRREAGKEVTVLSPRGELLTLTTDEALDLGFVELKADSLDDLLAAYTLVEVDGARAIMTAEQLARAPGESDSDGREDGDPQHEDGHQDERRDVAQPRHRRDELPLCDDCHLAEASAASVAVSPRRHEGRPPRGCRAGGTP